MRKIGDFETLSKLFAATAYHALFLTLCNGDSDDQVKWFIRALPTQSLTLLDQCFTPVFGLGKQDDFPHLPEWYQFLSRVIAERS